MRHLLQHGTSIGSSPPSPPAAHAARARTLSAIACGLLSHAVRTDPDRYLSQASRLSYRHRCRLSYRHRHRCRCRGGARAGRRAEDPSPRGQYEWDSATVLSPQWVCGSVADA